MIKFVKTFKVEFPVWVNGERTSEKETRIKALFVKESDLLNGLAGTPKFGSLVLKREVTEEQANAIDPDRDWSDELEFVPVEGSKFYNVRGL